MGSYWQLREVRYDRYRLSVSQGQNRSRDLGETPPEDPHPRVGEGGVWRCESTSLPAVWPALLQLGGHAGLGYERQRSGDPYRSSRVTSLPKSPKPGVIGHRRSAEKPLTKLLHLRNAHLRRCPRQGDAYATGYGWKGGPTRALDVRRGQTAIGVMHYERWQLPCFFPPARRFISKSLGGEALPNPLQRRRMTRIS